MLCNISVQWYRIANPCRYPIPSVHRRNDDESSAHDENVASSPGFPYVQDDQTSSPSSHFWYAPWLLHFQERVQVVTTLGRLSESIGLPKMALLAFGLLSMQISEKMFLPC